jgi:Tol biopolymer transport system component/tRNA A-37 threonylcarbamoyl transferase component Bud32
MALSIGTRLGAYEITGKVGAGGMGEVYRARDTKLGREVAIKTLPSALAQDRDRLARFEREAKLLAALNHAHIASVYGLDEQDGTLYLAMELIEGQTLETKLKDGALPVEDALRLALQVAEALEAAHEKGVVHRDLKPANVMVTPDGQVKVLDFGLAKAFAGDPSQAVPAHSPALSAAMTQQGLILGTAGYMSPEQASGQPTDQRADVWAFGVLLYEMLTGMPVFSGESVPHILAGVLRMDPDWGRLPKHVPARLKRLLDRCLKKKVRDRYHSMADVRVELEDLLRNPEEGVVASAPMRPLWRRALPAAVTLVLGVVLASAYLLSQRPTAAPVATAPTLPVSRFEITPPATAPLASLGGAQVAISPDGKRIAYFAEKPDNGNVELYVRELDALEARPIPGTEGRAAGNMNLFFSADGKSIGYFAPDRGGLISVTIDGRPSVKIVDTPSPAYLGGTWTADNTIVYSSGLTLQRVSAGGGGTPEPLMPERQSGGVAAPVVLPGGHAVLFHAVDGSGNDLVNVLDLQTGEEKTLVEGAANPHYVDSDHIVFSRGTTLMAVPFKASELAVTGEPVALIQGVRRTPGGASHFGLSATGTLVYEPTTDDSGSEALYAVVWVDRKGQVVERALSDLVTNPRDPRLSPDGTRLLLVTGSLGDADLWSYDLGGRPPIPLALPGDNRFPVWSPDSRRVVFARIQGRPELFTMPADGSVLTPQSLRGPMPVGAPHVWSAAGELILSANLNTPDIVATPAAAAGEPRPVVASEYAELDPALSPNGRWLAYVSDRTGGAEIWVQGYPDGVPVRVSRNGGYEPQWSRDGRELFYLQGNAMMAVAVKTDDAFSFGAPAQLFTGRYLTIPGPGARSYDVARDGRFLMILPGDESTAAAPRSIVVVQNFGEELKERARPSEK